MKRVASIAFMLQVNLYLSTQSVTFGVLEKSMGLTEGTLNNL